MLVEIQNFQSIARVEFPIKGYTALVGRSNIGKSAIIRALTCALQGSNGTHFVRHNHQTCARKLKGAAKCSCFSSVKVTHDNGDTVLWEKGDNVNQYTTTIGGETQVYSRVGRSGEPPPALEGYAPIRVGDSKINLHVSSQHHPIFLLDLPGPTIAEVLGDVANVDNINTASKLVTKDRKDASSTRKVREGDCQQLLASLASYEKLPSLVEQVNQAQDDYQQLTLKVGKLEKVTLLESSLRRASSDCSRIQGVLDVPLPSPGSLKEKAEKLERLSGLLKRNNAVALSAKQIKAVLDVPAPNQESLDLIQKTLSRCSRLAVWSKDLESKSKAVANLQKSLEVRLPDPAALGVALERLTLLSTLQRRGQASALAVKSLEGVLARLVVDDREDVLKSVLARLDKVSKYHQKLSALTSEVEALEADLSEVEEGISSVRSDLSDIGVCPTCSQSVDPEHILCGVQ